MDQAGTILVSLQTTNRFIILVSRMGKTLNGSFSRSMACRLVRLWTEVSNFPKQLPMKNISIKHWDVELGGFGEFGSFLTGGSGGFGRARAEQLLDEVRAIEMEFLKACMLSDQGMII